LSLALGIVAVVEHAKRVSASVSLDFQVRIVELLCNVHPTVMAVENARWEGVFAHPASRVPTVARSSLAHCLAPIVVLVTLGGAPVILATVEQFVRSLPVARMHVVVMGCATPVVSASVISLTLVRVAVCW
jgi:hypothetical protein